MAKKKLKAATPTRTRAVNVLADLVADPNNRRKHTPRNLDMITAALRDVGAARSIVIDEGNNVLAGNGVVAGANAAGLTKVQVVEADGDTIIAVRRRGLTDAQKRSLAIYDNRTGELAEWELPQFTADLAAGETFAPFFSPKELDALFKRRPLSAEVEAEVGASQFVIIVSCPNEADQTSLLERLMLEGISCRAVIS